MSALNELFFLIMSVLVFIGIDYGLYWYLSPISLQDQDYLYYGVGIAFLFLSYLTIKWAWHTAKELGHFFHWLILFVLDRHPGKYLLINDTKICEQKQRELEASPEYQQKEVEKRHLEAFYNSGECSSDIYYLLGRQEGLLQGELNGIKNTYDEAFQSGKSSAESAAIEAKNRQSSGGGFSNNNKPNKKKEDDWFQRGVKAHYQAQYDAWAHGDPDWMSK